MPPKSKRPCNFIGCRELTVESYCEEHKKAQHQLYKRTRTDHEEQSFYKSAQWKKVRDYKLRMNPLCEECTRQGRLKAAQMVDHKKPIKQGGARLEMNNLQSLCKACHNKKTANE